MPTDLAGKIGRLMTNSNSCTASFSQRALIEAITGDQSPVDKMVAEFRSRRDLVVQLLNEIDGVSCITPAGAFYVFPNVKSFGKPVKQLGEYLLQEANVAVLGGTAFGAEGEGYLRLSYANSKEQIREGVSRIKDALGKL